MRLATLLAADSVRPARPRHLHREVVVRAGIADTFAFFADAANLQQLTPPWLNFTILTPMPLAMRQGRLIDYRIRLYGLAIPWQTVIDVWEPGVRFVDRQLVGPYRWWRHEHRFAAVDGGTRVTDHVEYVPRARWLSAHWVARDLERIFDYRSGQLESRFGRTAARPET